jgi:hypothetical protein
MLYKIRIKLGLIPVEILEEYLPRLRGIMVSVASNQIELKSEPSRPVSGDPSLS